MRRLVYRLCRSFGVQLQRSRDPYTDLPMVTGLHGGIHVVDGGAFNGGTTRRLLASFPAATVHAFEPQTELFTKLSRQYASNQQVKLYPNALSDQPGEATLFVNQEAFTTSLLNSRRDPTITPREQRTIRKTTLDKWLQQSGGPVPSFIKLDLQGHELAALQGASGILERGVRAILTEVNFRSRYEEGCLYEDVALYLRGHGFRLYRMYELIVDPDGAWRQADALFVKETAVS